MHEFDKVDKLLELWDMDTETIHIENLAFNVFFPKLSMSFSKNENPLKIAHTLEKMERCLKKEILLF